jgi:O-antigen/teichoic acid export membrane protein
VSTARRIARNTGVQVAGETLSKLASLALYVVMARELGPTGFGEFTFALALVVLLTVFGNFGIDSLVAREVARRREVAEGLLIDGVVTKIAFGGLGAVAAIGVAAIGDYRDAVVLAVVLLALATVVDMTAKVFQATFQGLDDMAPVALSLLVQRCVTATAGIVLLLAGAGVATVALVWLGGSLVALALVAGWLSRRGVRPERRTSVARTRSLVAASFAIGLAGIFSTVLFRVDATMLSLIDGNQAVGLYGVAYRLLESTLFLSFAFVSALLPSLSRLTRDSTPTVAAVFELGSKVIAVTLVPVGAALVFFAEPILELLFGSEYVPAVTAARILGGAAFLYGFSYLGSYVLISQHRQRLLPWIVGGVTLFNVALNLVLIPAFSYDGAAAATTVCEATLAALMIGFAVRATGPIDFRRILAGPAAGAVAIAAAALALGDGPAGIAAAAAGYVAVLVAVERRLFPDDLRMVARTLARRRPFEDSAPEPG